MKEWGGGGEGGGRDEYYKGLWWYEDEDIIYQWVLEKIVSLSNEFVSIYLGAWEKQLPTASLLVDSDCLPILSSGL